MKRWGNIPSRKATAKLEASADTKFLGKNLLSHHQLIKRSAVSLGCFKISEITSSTQEFFCCYHRLFKIP